jgi:DNA-directed RNA polymerase subunit omega
MARVTVEDCLEQVENRFELVIMASRRARELQRGEPAIIDVKSGEKPTTTALREIASGKFSEKKLKQLMYGK